MKKYLYFRDVADEANDGVTGLKTHNPSSFLFPADNLVSMQPVSDSVLKLHFTPCLANNANRTLRDSVTLNIVQGDTFEVMDVIASAINEGPHSDGFIVIADDMTTTDSAVTAENDQTVQAKYVHKSINSVRKIEVNSPSTFGVHEYYEIVDIPTGAIADNDCFANLSISIPAQATLVEASITAVELSGSADASCALNVHTATVPSNNAAAGTEIIGADTAGSASLPNSDLNFGSGDAVGDTITGGTLISHESPLDRGTAESFFHLTVKEGSVNCTGTPKIGVYLKWYGPAAVAL